MPRGSRPGERRGGRQRGTPNKKTLIKNAVFLAAAQHPNQSPLEFMLALMRDPQVPFGMRLDMASIAASFVHAQRRALERWFAGPEGPQALFAGRILPFDEAAAIIWARLMAEGTVIGRPRSALDMMIAAVAEANRCVVVTDNERDFAGIKIINPLRIGSLHR